METPSHFWLEPHVFVGLGALSLPELSKIKDGFYIVTEFLFPFVTPVSYSIADSKCCFIDLFC